MQPQRTTNSQEALVELVRQARYQSEQLQLLNEEPHHIHLKIAHHAVIGASIAALIASVWIYSYLAASTLGTWFLIQYVTGQEGSHLVLDFSEPLFTVIARFILVFGGTWAPLTILSALLDLTRQSIFK